MSVSAVKLDRADNVVSLLRDHAAGERPVFEGGTGEALTADVPLGHKVALVAIAEGAPVIKFGARIGRATAAIAPGEHVHLHNLRGEIG